MKIPNLSRKFQPSTQTLPCTLNNTSKFITIPRTQCSSSLIIKNSLFSAMTPKTSLTRKHGTNLFVWAVAILCTVITLAVIITGIVIFIGYLAVAPKVPYISIVYTRLDVFEYDRTGVLTTKVSVHVKWENDNTRAHARFYDASFVLGLHGLEIARLVAPPFDVRKNSSVVLAYEVESAQIPLDQTQMMFLDASLKQDRVTFDLRGTARTRWRVGPLGSVRFGLHLNCRLHFIQSVGNSTGPYCSSRTK